MLLTENPYHSNHAPPLVRGTSYKDRIENVAAYAFHQYSYMNAGDVLSMISNVWEDEYPIDSQSIIVLLKLYILYTLLSKDYVWLASGKDVLHKIVLCIGLIDINVDMWCFGIRRKWYKVS